MLLTNEVIKEIEKKIGYEFKDKSYLEQAFTRKSYSEEMKLQGKTIPDNELLEYFGDSVLNYGIITILGMSSIYPIETINKKTRYRTPEELTNFVSFWTDKSMLSSKIQDLGISKYLIMSNGDKKKNVQNNLSAQEDLFEAIIGAIWYDNNHDYRIATNVALKMLDFSESEACYQKNPYTQLKEFVDQNPGYKMDFTAIGYGYELSLDNDDLDFHYRVRIPQKTPNNHHLAQADGANICIEKLKDEGLWDGNKRVISTNFTLDNVVNKLQELYQKKIIHQPAMYSVEYDYARGEWMCQCQLGDGSVFIAYDTYKANAKKIAAKQAYEYILGYYNGLNL